MSWGEIAYWIQAANDYLEHARESLESTSRR
jgi:hypothetical protein